MANMIQSDQPGPSFWSHSNYIKYTFLFVFNFFVKWHWHSATCPPVTPSNVALQCWFSSCWLMKAVVQVVVDLVWDFLPAALQLILVHRSNAIWQKLLWTTTWNKTASVLLPKDKLWQEWKRRWWFLARQCWAVSLMRLRGNSLRQTQPGKLSRSISGGSQGWQQLLLCSSIPGLVWLVFSSFLEKNLKTRVST